MNCASAISLLSLPWPAPIPLANWVPEVSERTFAIMLGLVVLVFFAAVAPLVKKGHITLSMAVLAFMALLAATWLIFPILCYTMPSRWANYSLARDIQHRMIEFCYRASTYEEAKQRLAEFRWQNEKVTYRPELTKSGEDGWVLVARPDRDSVPVLPLWERLLYRDFSRYRCPPIKTQKGWSRAEFLERDAPGDGD